MTIKEYDRVQLTDGRTGTVMAGTPNGPFSVDIGTTSETWDNIFVELKDIAKVLND